MAQLTAVPKDLFSNVVRRRAMLTYDFRDFTRMLPNDWCSYPEGVFRVTCHQANSLRAS